ncbi:MAG: type I-E CRISPR-associated endoribonuclease Cas2e [Candidatus Methylomirabilis sp.]|nr:type I-E CRISPR-associated endoribonuclease Cas2e [Deltaproteobacteria bacterium]
MTVIVLERASVSLRGELTRWLLEVRAGVFVGRVSRRVRERLWTKVRERNPDGGCLLIWTAPNEQGFRVETYGDTTRTLEDFDGLMLVRRS